MNNEICLRNYSCCQVFVSNNGISNNLYTVFKELRCYSLHYSCHEGNGNIYRGCDLLRFYKSQIIDDSCNVISNI